MRLNSSPLNSAFSSDHPYELQQVRQETEAWNNKSSCRYDTFRLQAIKLHHFPWISVCFICCFSLRLTHCFDSIPYPFRFFNDSTDRCVWRLPFKHVRLKFCQCAKNLHLVAQDLPKPKINFEPCSTQRREGGVVCYCLCEGQNEFPVNNKSLLRKWKLKLCW